MFNTYAVLIMFCNQVDCAGLLFSYPCIDTICDQRVSGVWSSGVHMYACARGKVSVQPLTKPLSLDSALAIFQHLSLLSAKDIVNLIKGFNLIYSPHLFSMVIWR